MLDAGVARFSVRGMFAGLALGALTRWIDNLPEGWRSLALIGGPWLGLAFALGAFMVLQGGRGRGAAIVGAIATIGAVLGYYGYYSKGLPITPGQWQTPTFPRSLIWWLNSNVPALQGVDGGRTEVYRITLTKPLRKACLTCSVGHG